LRRLTGLQLADFYDDWNICDVVEQHAPGNTPLGLKQITGILKQAQYLKRISSSKSTKAKPQDGRKTYSGLNYNKKFGGDRKGDKNSAPSAKGGSGAAQK
jgi:hypothetical protein